MVMGFNLSNYYAGDCKCQVKMSMVNVRGSLQADKDGGSHKGMIKPYADHIGAWILFYELTPTSGSMRLKE